MPLVSAVARACVPVRVRPPVIVRRSRGVVHSVTAVGGTIHVPETAVFFSGGGFSDLVRTRFLHRFANLKIQYPLLDNALICSSSPDRLTRPLL